MSVYPRELYDKRLLLRFDRQRRWLIIFTTILFVIDAGNVDITTISFIGNKLDIDESRANLFTLYVLPALVVYFIWTYLQALMEIQTLEWTKKDLQDWLIQNKKLAEEGKENLGDLLKVAQKSAVEQMPLPKIFNSITDTFLDRYSINKSNNKNFSFIRAFIHTLFITNKLTEYWLPVVVSSIVLVFALFVE